MVTLRGTCVSGGIAGGSLYFFRRRDPVVTATGGAGVEAEKARVAAAQERSIDQLRALADRAREEAGDGAAMIFETCAMFVEDDDFVACIMDTLEKERCSAEHAVQVAGERLSAMLAKADDPYIQDRAADVRDVARRILHNLTGPAERVADPDGPVILAADDLTPSETLGLDRTKILGFVTREGSDRSHTAILARTMGIPAICSLGETLKDEYAGRTVWMDGETGEVVLDPDDRTLGDFQGRQEQRQKRKVLLETMKGRADVTLDGREMTVCCNIGTPGEVQAVRANDGRGVGLFRSEFLYLAAGDWPSEEDQFQAYREVVTAMEGRRVVIRTLDMGADKQMDPRTGKAEENPAMGVRGIRLCFSRPDLFRTQLRAIYRASAWGRVAILFPMITSVWEVRECRRFCREVMAGLDADGIPYRKETEIGIMIETPAAVLIADALAKEADFFSVGTNDLTQYILACDRNSGELGRFSDPHHPAVLRALKIAADAAHGAGIRIGICGDLAADLSLLETFLAMGIDELSVSPDAVLPLRAAIRGSVARTCTLDRLDVQA